jgi:hypothetical protein
VEGETAVVKTTLLDPEDESCERCELDMALYGRTVFHTTGDRRIHEHYDAARFGELDD